MPNVKSPGLQFALREWWAHISAPRVVFVMAAVAGVLVWSGPFATSTLPPLTRIAYWVGMVWGTYTIGYFINIYTLSWLARRSQWLQVAGFAVLNGVVVAVFVALANIALTGGSSAASWWAYLGYGAELWAVAAVVSALLALISQQSTPPEPDLPLLMDRLAPPLRGPVIALSAEDHYTRIRTPQGEDMVLMALRDAIREAAPTQGIQIHRSHWVATAHIAQVLRTGGKTRVVLTDGTELPVSRANTAALRELGY